jgi:hypothetical protein
MHQQMDQQKWQHTPAMLAAVLCSNKCGRSIRLFSSHIGILSIGASLSVPCLALVSSTDHNLNATIHRTYTLSTADGQIDLSSGQPKKTYISPPDNPQTNLFVKPEVSEY